MSEPATIDLGVLAGEDDRPEPWTVTWRRWVRRLRRRRQLIRRWSPALLVVLTALPVAAGAPPPPPQLARVWTEPSLSLSAADRWSRAVPGDTQLYAVERTGAGAALTAYRLADGRVAWRAALDPGGVAAIGVAAGVPVVISEGPRVTAYHPDSGRWLWRRPGAPRQEVGGLLLVAAGAPDGDGEVVTAVDPRTGEVAGAVTERADRVAAPWHAPDGRPYLFTLSRDGTLARHPMTGGTPVTVETPYRQRDGEPRQDSLAVVDDLVVVVDRTAPDRGVAAYDPTTLRYRWAVAGGYQAASCAPVICVRVADDPEPYDAVRGIDAVSGASRWSASCADLGYAGTPCALGVRGLGPGRLWVELVVPDRYTHGSRVTSWVLDAATGRPLTTRAGWSLRERYDDGHLLVSRSDRNRASGPVVRPRNLWWGRAGTAGDVDVLGAVDATQCLPRHPYLVCEDGAGGVTVWRIRG